MENDQNPDSLVHGFLSTAELLATQPKRGRKCYRRGCGADRGDPVRRLDTDSETGRRPC